MKKERNEGRKKTPFEILHGKEVTIQEDRGAIIDGTFVGQHDNFFILSNAVIKGTKHICKTDLVFIHKNRVAHFHLKGEVLPKEEA